MAIGLHYESEIFIHDDPVYGKVVQKRYKQEHECIKWLNSELQQYYSIEGVLPVALHEATALKILEPHEIAPKLIGVIGDSLFMEYAGEPLEELSQSDRTKLAVRARSIQNKLRELNFKHNDLLERNILVQGDKLRLIDFTLSEFNGINLMNVLPNRDWAYPQLNEKLEDYFAGEESPESGVATKTSNLDQVKDLASKIYSYHNLGTGLFPEGEEKTPHGSGERYNFDRMYMMVSNYDFTKKNVLDIGCNSGWFAFQAKLLGSNVTVGLDYSDEGMMGQAILYAMALEKRLNLGVNFFDVNAEKVDFEKLKQTLNIKSFDVCFILSVLHHIHDKQRLWGNLYNLVNDVIFYEDHEFWNEIYDDSGAKISVKGEGHRFGWNEDLSWQRKMGSIERYERMILDNFRGTWRRETLMMDRFKEIRFLGFSEKRRPFLAFYK